MFSGKNKKNSILLLALVAMLAAALSLFGITAIAEITDPIGDFAYVEGGETVYNTVSASDYVDKTEMLAQLEEISALSKTYADAINPSVEGNAISGLTASLAFEKYDLYLALLSAVDNYNAFLSENGYAASLTVAVKETFTYPRVGVEPAVTAVSDITGDVVSVAIKELQTLASNWSDATGSEYILKYFLNDEYGNALLEVYVADTGAPLIIEKNAEFIKNNASGLVQELVIKANGKQYSVTVTVSTKSGIDSETLTPTKNYEASVYTVKDESGNVIYNKNEGTSQTHFTAVVDEDYKTYTETVSEILLKANNYFKAPVPNEIKGKYEEFVNAIANKISAVKAVYEGKLEAVSLERNEELFEAEVYANLVAAYESGVEEIRNATTYKALDGIYQNYKAQIEGYKSLPEEIRETYSSLLIPNRNYVNDGTEACEFETAFAVIARIDQANLTVQDILASERDVLLANVTRTAEKEINALAEGINTTGLATSQIRELGNKRNEAISAVKLAGNDDEEIKLAFETFTAYIGNLNFKTINELSADRITVKGIFDENTTLSSSLTTVTDETDEGLIKPVEDVKKNVAGTRLTDVLEIFDLSLYLDGKALNYNDDNGYTVTVELDDATLEYFRVKGIDVKSVVVAFVREGETKPEIYETTLVFRDANGSVLYDSATAEGSAGVEWDKIAEGTIMFTTQHFSSYYLMGNTSNLALVRLTNLLSGIADSQALTYVLIGLGVLIGVILLIILVSFIVSLCFRYKITFDSNGGSSVKPIKSKYGKKLPTFRTPTKSGYVFDAWCIEPTLKYEFNRTVMPRANVTLYARWVEETAVETVDEELKERLVEYYDRLRVKLLACSLPDNGKKSFVEEEVLARLFLEDDHVKLLVKTVKEFIKEEEGVAYVINNDDKFIETSVYDELSFDIAVANIEKMVSVNGLEVGDEPEIIATAYDDAVIGYVYGVTYNNVADYDYRCRALRSFAIACALTDEAKAENGKVVFELIPDEDKSVIALGLSLDMAKYGKILAEKSVGTLGKVYDITAGADMGVACELVERVMVENGFTPADSYDVDEEYAVEGTYQYVIALQTEEVEVVEEVEEVVEVVEEVDLAQMFNEYRAYVCSFALFTDGEEDRSNDGLLVIKAKLYSDEIRTTVDPECDAEAFSFNTKEGFEQAKEKVNAVMTKYGLEYNEDATVEELELGDEEAFGYRIAFPPIMTAEELLAEIRNYANSFAMFIDEDAEVDTKYDGTVVVKACIKDDAVVVTVDPDAETQEFVVAKEEDLVDAKYAITAAMAKYGMEIDGDYTPADDAVEGNSFGFRIRFDN